MTRIANTIPLLPLKNPTRCLKLMAFLLLQAISFFAWAQPEYTATTLSLMGNAKYSADFSHFEYVNPEAPKGGSLTLSALGTFDTFNRYALRGHPAERTDEVNDTLFVASLDETGSYYPLIAQSVTYPADYKWIEVDINPKARFHDGQPITADDVVFSFAKFMTEGIAQYRTYFSDASVSKVAERRVRFEFSQTDRIKIIGLVAGLRILPKHYWQDYNLGEPLNKPPLGSGAYQVVDYKLGQYVIYQRVADYWAADLPVNKGSYNFDSIRYDYYQDDNVSFEAFKAGAYDLRLETQPKNWASKYFGSPFDKQQIIKAELKNLNAPNTHWLALNTQRAIFSDRRVRQALTLAFDFNWINNAYYYGAYQRPRSYFQNTIYAAQDLPNADELNWLTPLRDAIPTEVFSQIYTPPSTDGSGNNRDNLLQALELLQQAGWHMQNQRLINSQTGQPFTFEILLQRGSPAQYIASFKYNLSRLGIEMQVREVDSSQYLSRMQNRDFDMMPMVYTAFAYPTPGLAVIWGSAYLNSSYNGTGFSSPAIDALIQQIIKHQTDPQQLIALGRALDRVLTWHQLMIPLWYPAEQRIAYWNKFSRPKIAPVRGIGINSWWVDPVKLAELNQPNGGNQ